jgi:hypothetical protein
MMMRYMLVGLGLAAVLIAVAGCGGSGGLSTVKVTGTVIHKGKPAQGVMVTFVPEKGRPASGITDASGRFVLSTLNSGDGAMPGKHAVTLTESFQDKPPPMPGMGRPLPSRFPPQYGDPKKTPLTREVQAGGKNDFPFDVAE